MISFLKISFLTQLLGMIHIYMTVIKTIQARETELWQTKNAERRIVYNYGQMIPQVEDQMHEDVNALVQEDIHPNNRNEGSQNFYDENFFNIDNIDNINEGIGVINEGHNYNPYIHARNINQSTIDNSNLLAETENVDNSNSHPSEYQNSSFYGLNFERGNRQLFENRHTLSGNFFEIPVLHPISGLNISDQSRISVGCDIANCNNPYHHHSPYQLPIEIVYADNNSIYADYGSNNSHVSNASHFGNLRSILRCIPSDFNIVNS